MKKQTLTTLTLAFALTACFACSSMEVPEDLGQSAPANVSAANALPNREPLPELPPAVSVESILNKAHESYSEFTGSRLAETETCWKISGMENPFEFGDAARFNQLLKFAYCADLEIQISLAKMKGLVALTHVYLDGADLAGFRSTLLKLTAENFVLRERILKAALFYRVPVSELTPELVKSESIAKPLDQGTSNLLHPVTKKMGLIFATEGMSDECKRLLESVSVAFTSSGGVPALLSFENFLRTESDLLTVGIVYPFEDGQGGFGAADPEQVRFLE